MNGRRLRLLGLVLSVIVVVLAAEALPAGAALSVQRLGFCGGDDWEPDVAADSAGHVFVLITHFAGDTTCDAASGQNGRRIMIQVSSNGGASFGAPRVVSDSPGGIDYPSQADPSIAVDSTTGAVYVAFLAYGLSGGHTDIYVAKSTNFGASFPEVVKVNNKNFQGVKGCKNCDHEKLLAHGDHVYVAYGQAQYHFISISTDGGRSFAQHTVDSTFVVTFAEGAALDATGNAWFAWGDCETSNCTGSPAADYRVSETLAGTESTTFSPVLARSAQGPDCPFSTCGFAYFGPQDDIAIDGGGTIYLAWQDGQSQATRKSPPVIRISRCSSNCLSGSGWSLVGRADDKTASRCPDASCYALFPNIVAGEAGQLSVTWMDDRNDSVDGSIDHVGGWNLWYRSSTNGGATWTAPGLRISQFDPRQSQSRRQGFFFPYGDYDGLMLNPNCQGRAIMTWGEGHDWLGGPSAPGHIEYASLC